MYKHFTHFVCLDFPDPECLPFSFLIRFLLLALGRKYNRRGQVGKGGEGSWQFPSPLSKSYKQ